MVYERGLGFTYVRLFHVSALFFHRTWYVRYRNCHSLIYPSWLSLQTVFLLKDSRLIFTFKYNICISAAAFKFLQSKILLGWNANQNAGLPSNFQINIIILMVADFTWLTVSTAVKWSIFQTICYEHVLCRLTPETLFTYAITEHCTAGIVLSIQSVEVLLPGFEQMLGMEVTAVHWHLYNLFSLIESCSDCSWWPELQPPFRIPKLYC